MDEGVDLDTIELQPVGKFAEDVQTRKNIVGIVVAMIFFIAFAYGLYFLETYRAPTYTNGEIHWHALVNITICGTHRDLPSADSRHIAHEKPYLGSLLLHTHDDNVIHVEGVVHKKEDISLGKFFDSISVPFDSDRIMEVKNGDFCNGTPGVLQMFVNDQPRKDFRDYVPFPTTDAQRQVISLVFASAQT